MRNALRSLAYLSFHHFFFEPSNPQVAEENFLDALFAQMDDQEVTQEKIMCLTDDNARRYLYLLCM